VGPSLLEFGSKFSFKSSVDNFDEFASFDIFDNELVTKEISIKMRQLSIVTSKAVS